MGYLVCFAHLMLRNEIHSGDLIEASIISLFGREIITDIRMSLDNTRNSIFEEVSKLFRDIHRAIDVR